MGRTDKWPEQISSLSDIWEESLDNPKLPASVPDLIWEYEIKIIYACLFQFYYKKFSAYTLLRSASHHLPHYGILTKVEERAYNQQRTNIKMAEKHADKQFVNSYNAGLRNALFESSNKIVNTRLNMIRKMLRGLQVPDGTFKTNGRTYEITDEFVDLVYLLFQIHDEDEILYRDICAGKLSTISNKWMHALYFRITRAIDASSHKDKVDRKHRFENGLLEKHAHFKPQRQEIDAALVPAAYLSFIMELAGKYFAEYGWKPRFNPNPLFGCMYKSDIDIYDMYSAEEWRKVQEILNIAVHGTQMQWKERRAEYLPYFLRMGFQDKYTGQWLEVYNFIQKYELDRIFRKQWILFSAKDFAAARALIACKHESIKSLKTALCVYSMPFETILDSPNLSELSFALKGYQADDVARIVKQVESGEPASPNDQALYGLFQNSLKYADEPCWRVLHAVIRVARMYKRVDWPTVKKLVDWNRNYRQVRTLKNGNIDDVWERIIEAVYSEWVGYRPQRPEFNEVELSDITIRHGIFDPIPLWKEAIYDDMIKRACPNEDSISDKYDQLFDLLYLKDAGKKTRVIAEILEQSTGWVSKWYNRIVECAPNYDEEATKRYYDTLPKTRGSFFTSVFTYKVYIKSNE